MNTNEASRLWEGLEDEKVSRIAGDEANKQLTLQVQQENSGTEGRLSTEVIQRSQGDLNNITSLNALAQAMSDYRIKTDLEINNERIAREQLGVQLEGRINTVEASFDHNVFLIYQAIQDVQNDVDGKYATLDTRVTKYEQMLSDITTDSIQITMDNGEINMGAWTILSQAREWDLEILRNVKVYQDQTNVDINQALEDMQNKLPIEQDIIDKAIEQMSNSQVIKDLDSKLDTTIDGLDRTNEALAKEVTDRQDQMIDLTQSNADQIKAFSDSLNADIQKETNDRITALQRESAIRQEQLNQEALDRSAEIDERIKDLDINVDVDLTELKDRIDTIDGKIVDLTQSVNSDLAAMDKRVDDVNTKADEINVALDAQKTDLIKRIDTVSTKADSNKADADAKITDLNNKATNLQAAITAEESARIADIKTLNDGLTAEITARKEGDTANITALNNYKASNDAALANVRDELSANVTATEANATKLTALDVRLTTNEGVATEAKSLAASATQKADTALTETAALSNQMTTVNASIDGIKNDLANKAEAAALQQLQAEVTAVDGKVTTNTTELTNLKSTVTGLDGKVTGNTTAISELNTKQEAQGNQITQLTTDTTALKNTVESLEEDMATKVESTAFNQLSTKVDKNASDITAQSGSIIKLQSDLAATNQKVDTKADASALQTLDTKVTNIDGKVTSNTTAITNLTGRVSTAENDIKKKLDASVIDAYSTTVETNKAIADRITQYDANLYIGGQNIWSVVDNPVTNEQGAATKLVINSMEEHFKNTVVSFNATGSIVTRIDNALVDKNFGFKVGDDFVVSFEIRASKAAIAAGLFYYMGGAGSLSNNVPLTTEWVRMVYPVKATGTAVDSFRQMIGLNLLKAHGWVEGDWYEVRRVQMQRGKKATEYQKASAKIEVKLDATANAVQQIQTKVTEQDGKITSNATAITNLSNRVTKAEGDITKKADASAVNSLTTKVETLEGTVTSQGTAVTKLQNDLATTNSKVDKKAEASALTALDNKVTEQGGLITSQGSAITKLQNDVAAIDLELDGVASADALQALDTKVTNQGNTLASQGTAITKLENDLSLVSQEIDTKADASALTALDSKVTSIDNTVTSHSTALTGLTNRVDKNEGDIKTKADSSVVNDLSSKVDVMDGKVTSQGTAITKLVNDVEAINTDLDGKADSTALQALDNKVTSIDGKVTTNASAITSLSGRVTATEQGLTTKADSTAVNALTNRVEKTEQGLVTQASNTTKLEARVGATTGASEIPDFMLANPDLWYSHYNYPMAQYFKTTDTGKVGPTVFRKDSSNPVNCWNYSRIALPNDKAYKVRMWVRKSTDALGSVHFTAIERDAKGAYISYVNKTVTAQVNKFDEWILLEEVMDYRATINAATLYFGFAVGHTRSEGVWEVQGYSVHAVLTTADMDGSVATSTALTSTNAEVTKLNGTVTAQGNQITSLQASVAGKADASAVANLSTKVETLEGKTTSQGTQITKLQNDLVATNAAVETKASASAVTALDNKVTQQGEAISSQSSSITKLQNDLAETNQTVDGKAEASALSALDTKVTTIDGKVTSQGTQLTELKNSLDNIDLELDGKADSAALTALDSKVTQQGADIAAQSSAITNLSGRITTNENSIKTKAEASTVATLDSKVTAIDGKVTSQGSAITKLQNDLTTTNANVEKKADTAALNSLSNTVTQQGKDITANSGAITKVNASLTSSTNEIKLTGVADSLVSSVPLSGEVTLVAEPNSVTGSVIRIGNNADNDTHTILNPAYIPIDVNKLYRVTTRYRRVAGEGTVYLGLTASNADKSRNIMSSNIPTAIDVVSSSLYFVANDKPALGTWVTREYFYKGKTTVSEGNGTLASPRTFPGLAAYFRVCMLPNYQGLPGIQEIDYIIVEDYTAQASANANAAATTALTARVTETEKGITTQSNSITKLQNDLVQTTAASDNAALLATYQGQGKLIWDDPTFTKGVNGVIPYGAVGPIHTLVRALRSADNPTASTHEMVDTLTGDVNTGQFGFYPQINTSANKVFLHKYVMKVPVGITLLPRSNAVGVGGVDRMIGLSAGTGKYETYWRLTNCGTSGSFSTTGHIAFRRDANTPVPTPDKPLVINIAQVAVFDVTDAPDAVPQDLYDKVNANSTAIQTLDSKVTQQGKDIASVSTAQTVLANRVTVVEGGLSSKAEASAVQQLDSRVTAVDGRVTSNTSAITNLTGRVTTVESGLATKADASALNNYYTKVDADKAIAGQISNYDATLVIGGTNIQSNSNEVVHSNNSTSFAEMQYVKGTPNKIINKSNKGKVSTYTLSFFTAEVGKTYTASVRVKPSIDTQLNFASFTNSQWERVKEGPSNCLKDVWTTLWFTFTARTTSIRLSGFHRESGFANDVVVEYRDYQVEEGNKVTAWSPSYVDINKAITTNASAIQTTNTEVSRINGVVVSQGTQITNLNSSLTTTNNNVTAAQAAANNAMAAAGEKGKVIYGSTAPAVVDQLPQNLWIDTTGNANTPKRWNGNAWAAVTDKVATDAAAAAAKAQATANTKADASAVSSLESRTTAVEGNITSLSTQTTSLSNRLTTAEGKITANTTALSTLNSKVTNIDGRVTSQAASITKLQSDLTGLDGKIAGKADASAVTSLDTKVTALDGKVTTQATSITQLQTTVDGHTASLLVQGEVVDGLKASYVVKTDVDGLVAGYGLYNTGSTSAFAVNAEYFYVGKAAGGKKPFMVLTSPQTIGGVTYPAGTWIDVALIANATIGTAHIADAAITTAKIKDLAVDNAKIKDLHGDKITANSISGDKIKAKSVTADKMEVDELSAVSANLGSFTTVAADGSKQIISGGKTEIYYPNGKLAIYIGI